MINKYGWVDPELNKVYQAAWRHSDADLETEYLLLLHNKGFAVPDGVHTFKKQQVAAK